MSTYLQADRPLAVATPLGADVLLLVGFSGHEAISQLFTFRLDMLAENSEDVAFDKLLGQWVTIRLGLGGTDNRYLNGVCNRISQGNRDETFTSYHMEVVPAFWLLTRRAQSRIFQHVSVPDILKKVLAGLDVKFELQGTFQPRDFCVQYRETDFNFASRIMEEEGIYYFFKHSASGHTMVLANTPQSHPDLPVMKKVSYDELIGGGQDEGVVRSWEKVQELRAGKYSLWDHSFELPHKHLEADEPIVPDVKVGDVTHKLRVGGNQALELYDYPGGYAQRFDGVNKSGGAQPADLQNIFEDNKRTVKIRMQQETVPGIVIQGDSDCRDFVCGHKFELQGHFDANGSYLLTSVSHSARMSSDYRSGDGEFDYQNSFTCIPFAVPYRPPMVTPKPAVRGTQTAVIVGPQGEEIFVDKYGRVKVQFHWDREGQADSDSSCWIRVAQTMAGMRWGSAYWPRIGHEVIVDFIEGDPDQPIIVGSVYNAAETVPYTLPAEKTKTVIYKSNSTIGGGGFNEIRIEDSKGKEQIFIHGEKDQDVRIKNDRREWIGNDRHLIVKRDKLEQIERDEHNLIKRDQLEEIRRDHHLKIKGKEAIAIDGSYSATVGGDVNEKFSKNHNEEAGQSIHIKAGMTLILEAGMQISLKVGGNFIDISPAGVAITGTMVLINSGGAAGSGPGASPAPPSPPKEAEIADNADPGSVSQTYKSQRAAMSPLQMAAASAPWHDPSAEKEQEKKKSWIEIVLVDEENKPVPGEAYLITLPDGTTIAEGTLDEKGFARVDGIDPGTCKVTFPNLDKDAWEPK